MKSLLSICTVLISFTWSIEIKPDTNYQYVDVQLTPDPRGINKVINNEWILSQNEQNALKNW